MAAMWELDLFGTGFQIVHLLLYVGANLLACALTRFS